MTAVPATWERTTTSGAAASAPGKVILFGEHGVNRGSDAIVVAVEPRARCTVVTNDSGRFELRTGNKGEEFAAAELSAFAEQVGALREAGDRDALVRLVAADFLAPMRYVLAALVEPTGVGGALIRWSSSLPIGAGLGSGAAAGAALVLALHAATGRTITPADVGALAWLGDVVAHGGTASALDSSGCALGGVVRFNVEHGARPMPSAAPLTLIVADSGVTAATADVNAHVRARLGARPALEHAFRDMNALADGAERALADGDHARLGSLMTLNHLLLARLGVSCPELDTLVEAALGAGALGAKLSGSGGGGIVVALVDEGHVAAVSAALAATATRVWSATSGVEGVRPEPFEPSIPS